MIAYSADITVTVNDALPPSNTGDLTIEIDAALNNAPFTITVERTGGGYTYQIPVSNYSLYPNNLNTARALWNVS